MGYAPTLRILVPIQFLALSIGLWMDFQQLCPHGSTAAAVTLHSQQHAPSLFPIRLPLNCFLCTFSLSVFSEKTTAGEKTPGRRGLLSTCVLLCTRRTQVEVSVCCKVAVLIQQLCLSPSSYLGLLRCPCSRSPRKQCSSSYLQMCLHA